MKKILSFTLSLIMILSLFVSCANDENSETSSNSEQSAEQGGNNTIAELYYDTIELSKSDFAEYPSYNILYDYFELEAFLTQDALEKIDESVMEGNALILCNLKSGFEFVGFKKIKYFNSEPKIICENNSYYPYDIFASEYNPERIFGVVVPLSDIPKGISNMDFEPERTTGYAYTRKLHAPQLGNEEKLFIFNTDKELLDFEEQIGIAHSGAVIVNERYVTLAHYMPITYHNQSFVRYQNFSKVSDNTFTIERFEMYNGEVGASNNSSSLFYVTVPRTEFFEGESLTGSVVRVVETTSKTTLKEPATSQYLSVLYTLKGEECDLEFLPQKHGTYMLLAKNEIEAKALGLENTERLNEIFYDNYVLLVYRYYESYGFNEIGFKNLKSKDGKNLLTVDEVKNDSASGEYKTLSYVIIPKEKIAETGFEFELETNEIEYYDFEKGNGSPSRERAYYMYHTYEDFVKDFSNEVDPQKFDTHFVLAVRRYKGMGVDYTIGYRDFYLKDNVIHITLDEGVTYLGNAKVYEWFDIVFIPKELACLEYKLEISANRIHNNAIHGY
ncbi:MAG: hypothetical protein IJZ04_08135 [Clostridia bacterium]|nr:hypothetical protein [Clostridia bacterium]